MRSVTAITRGLIEFEDVAMASTPLREKNSTEYVAVRLDTVRA
jgi:hypothetical protein